jgi:hypothetical protein
MHGRNLFDRHHSQVRSNAPDGAFDAGLEGHFRGRASRAGSDKSDARDGAIERHEFEIAAISIQNGAEALNHGFDGFMEGHDRRREQLTCQMAMTGKCRISGSSQEAEASGAD